jgi:tRNA threonylcarbamoyladenosine biosynthesis protein TsaB
MNVLALDTSTDRAAVGLSIGTEVHSTLTLAAPGRHGRDLIPQLAVTLRDAGLGPRDVDLIAVGLGPGSYTGLRVGLAAAKTLAYATGVPIIGLDSMEALARNAPAKALRISVIADAQRGDVYLAEFVRDGPGAALVSTLSSRIEPLSDWLARLEPGVLVLGPGLEAPSIRAALPPGISTPGSGLDQPDGRRLLELAREAWESGRRDNPWLLEPRYLRKSAAEEQWERNRKPKSERPAIEEK